MQATLQTYRDGTLTLRMDQAAAQAVFASILFASKFHEGIAPLTAVAKSGMASIDSDKKGVQPCQ